MTDAPPDGPLRTLREHRRSPLHGFSFPIYGARLEIAELPFLTQLNVRATPDAVDAAGAALGVSLPRTPNTITRAGPVTALWLGPDEWLAVNATPPAAATPGVSVVDVSAQRTTISLGGPTVLAVLSHGCALDLHRLGRQWCAQTELARTTVILWGVDGRVHILVRASFARYLATWLVDAAISAEV